MFNKTKAPAPGKIDNVKSAGEAVAYPKGTAHDADGKRQGATDHKQDELEPHLK